MKIHSNPFVLLALFAATHAASATPVVRNDAPDNLNLATAWSGGVAPGTANTATWDASSSLTNTMGGNITWGALDVSGAAGPVAITGANTLLLNHATDADTAFNTGANTFSWGAAGTGGGFNINGAAGGASSTATGATFAGSGTVTISSTGTKNWSSPNATNGVTNVTFTGTLALRGAPIPPVGALSGNWLAFGGGGGAASNPGTATQTGSFALDLGDETSCGSFILTHAWSGQALKLNSLQGTGSIRTDWGISAGTQTRGIELDQAHDTTLSGSILAHNGSGQRRNVDFVKKGPGTLTLTGAIGASGSTASLTFDLQGGKIQLGDGGTTPTIVGPLDTANATFAIAAGAELAFIRSGSFNWPYSHSGEGAIRLNAPGGSIAFTGSSPSFAGEVSLDGGVFFAGPSLGGAVVTCAPGTIINPGLPAAAGSSTIGSLVLNNGSESDFRIGATTDSLILTGGLTPPGAGETHTINIFNEPTVGGTITLIDYQGAPLGEDEFSSFQLGLTPFLGSFRLVNNTANSSIDLEITLQDQVWKGFSSGDWDLITENWVLAGEPAVPTFFSFENPVRFDDSALVFGVAIDEFGVAPLSVTIDNSANPYTFTGGPITGNTGLAKSGTGSATLTQPNTYAGGTAITAGTLQIGNGGETGDIGGGPVTISQNATLAYLLDDTSIRDYKAVPKMRNVSGAGDIILDGGFTFFNYTGSGLGFNEPNSWSQFTGTLAILGGSEFRTIRTIRNGRTAMGSAMITLGDATTSGHLAQIEGNWAWTNDIQLTGPANEIRNRSITTPPRILKLQGAISGNGGIAFTDIAGTMTNNQLGFILTGENTLAGTLTINPGAPVRIGGVPGDSDIFQNGAGIGGTLGTATVVNHGSLTFSRSDSHVVTSPISGTGAVFIGLSTGNDDQEMTYAGTANHTGGTTVRSGTLTIAPAGNIGGTSLTVADGAKLIIDGSSIADTTTLNLGAAALVDLTGTEVVAELFIADVQAAAGTWGATGSGADHIDDTRFTGTGLLSVTAGTTTTGYADWAATNAPTGGPGDDFDGDGVPNAIEYILGGDKDTNDLAKLPAATTSDGDFVFSFIRAKASKTPDTTVRIELSTNLVSWATSFDVDAAPEVTLTEIDADWERVTLTLPRNPDARKFARLAVEVN